MKPNDVMFDNGTIKDVIRVNPVNNDYDEKSLTSQLVEFAGGTIFDNIELRTINEVKLGVNDLYWTSEEDQPIQVKLTKPGDWSYEQFMSFHKIVSFACTERCTNGTTKVKKILRANLNENYSFELMNRFEEAFTEFKKSVENQVSRIRFHPIKITGAVANKSIEISSHDHLAKILIDILDSSFASLFPEIKNMAFVPRPNGVDEHGDLYYQTIMNNKITSSKCVAEIKTRKKIEFNVPDVIEEVKRKKSFLSEAIYETAGQLLDTKDVPKAMLLTCHEYTYFLYTEDESNIIQISPIIKRGDFFQAVLLVLSLSFAPISQELSFNLDRFKAEFTNQTNENESIQPRNSTQLKLNDVEYCSELFTARDFIKARKDSIKFGFGSCGSVSRFDLNGRSYVDKSCSIFKSKEGVLDQLRNEFEILMQLNSKVQSDKRFFPGVYFYGPTFVTIHIVMDFIEGHQIDDFNDKSVTLEIKEKCLKRVEELHAIRLLHGDLRAPNFILASSGVFIIDFGLSRFVGPDEENELEFEMTRFRKLLNV